MSGPSGTTSGQPIVEVENVHKYFGSLHVLKGVGMTVQRGEVIVLIGPSGSGKSTLLRCINHLEKIDEGRIRLNGHPMGYREAAGRPVEPAGT